MDERTVRLLESFVSLEHGRQRLALGWEDSIITDIVGDPGLAVQFTDASTTTTASLIPEMMRLRPGKLPAKGSEPPMG